MKVFVRVSEIIEIADSLKEVFKAANVTATQDYVYGLEVYETPPAHRPKIKLVPNPPKEEEPSS